MRDVYRFYHNHRRGMYMVYQMYVHVDVFCDQNCWQSFGHNIDMEMVVLCKNDHRSILSIPILKKKTYPVWVRLWILRFSDRAKTFPQRAYGQANGFSPVWTRIWLTSLYFALNARPCLGQSSHRHICVDCSDALTCSTVKWVTNEKKKHQREFSAICCF